jgi:uncharacterized protein (TIGR00369 family)
MIPEIDPFTPTGFDSLIGTEYLELTAELARARFTVRDELKQPLGLLHGGVIASVAESLASVATAAAVVREGKGVSGLSNQTSFLRPIFDGVIDVTAVRKHSGRTTWVWELEFTDAGGRICALTRMTIAVRELSGEERALPGAKT